MQRNVEVARPSVGPVRDRYVTRLCGHAFEPPPHFRIWRKVELRLVSYMRVGIQRDVRDRVTSPDKERPSLELRLHHLKRESSLLQAHGKLRAAGRVERQVPEDEARSCHERLVAGLLEEHPLQHLRT